jgi:peptidoglycan hydrolase CwlO-like protein
MANIQEKIQSLYADLEATVEKYNEALGVVNVSKEKIIALQGALEALRSLQEEDNIVAANAIVDAS